MLTPNFCITGGENPLLRTGDAAYGIIGTGMGLELVRFQVVAAGLYPIRSNLSAFCVNFLRKTHAGRQQKMRQVCLRAKFSYELNR
jgi:hypothetical protein